MAATSATSTVDKMHFSKSWSNLSSEIVSTFCLTMAATRATSLVDKMHYCGFLITRAGTRATSLVDKMHFSKFMERERFRLQMSAF
jgi:hypothetical protein